MDYITIGKNKIPLTSEVQTAPSGREFKLRSITKIGEGKFINNTMKYYWQIRFTYLDDNSVFGFEVDYFNNFVKKL